MVVTAKVDLQGWKGKLATEPKLGLHLRGLRQVAKPSL